MSPKFSSLAIDEVKETVDETTFQPKLEVLVKTRNGMVKYPVSAETNSTVIKIGGRITISF